MPSPGRSGVPFPWDSLVWFPWRGGSGVPSPGGEGLVCPPLQMLFLLSLLLLFSLVALVNTPSCTSPSYGEVDWVAIGWQHHMTINSILIFSILAGS